MALRGVAGTAGRPPLVPGAGRRVLLTVEPLPGSLGEGAEEAGEEGADEAEGEQSLEGPSTVRVGAPLETLPGVPEREGAADRGHHDHGKSVTQPPASAIWRPWWAMRSTRQAAVAATSEPTATPIRRAGEPPSWSTQVIPKKRTGSGRGPTGGSRGVRGVVRGAVHFAHASMTAPAPARAPSGTGLDQMQRGVT